MKKKGEKKKSSYWLLPEVILILVIVALLIQFSGKSKNKEQDEVEKQMVATMQTYAFQVDQILGGVEKSARTAAGYFAENGANGEIGGRILNSVKEAAGLYEVVYCDVNGNGFDSENKTISVGDAEYFSEITENGSLYVFTPDDGMTGEAAIVVAVPVKKGDSTTGYILEYCDLSFFRVSVSRANFGADAYYMLLKVDGTVLAMTGNTGAVRCDEMDDFNKYLMENGQNSRAVSTMKMRMNNRQSDVVEVQQNKGTAYLVFVPACEGNFYLVAGVDDSYVEKMLTWECSDSRRLILELGITMIIFMVLILVNGITASIREKEKSQKLENKADTDLLTDLYNKLATEGKIKEHLAARPNELGLLLVLDIDNFKKINDTMGHAFGDEVLRTLGRQMKAAFRSTDILGRTGGDEFMIFLCNMKDPAVIKNEAKRIENFFRTFQAGEYVKYSATASIGAAIYPNDAKDFESLYKAADSALYVAKKRGKNQLAFYGEETAEQTEK